MNWDHYRYFLAVAKRGSLSAAARSLGVSQPTVGRQINDLEARLGSKLFVRESHGYSLTPAGQQIFAQAKGLALEVSRIERLVEGGDDQLAGAVRIAATEGFGSYWLTQKTAQIQKLHPEIHMSLLLDQVALESNAREADLRIRFQQRSSSDEIAHRLGQIGFGFYGVSQYFETNGVPNSLGALAQHHFVDWYKPSERYPLSQMVEKFVTADRVAYRSNRFAGQVEAALTGVGMILAPHYVAARYPQLLRVLSEEVNLVNEAWLYGHRDLRHTARVRLVHDYIANAFEQDAAMLENGAKQSPADPANP